MFFPVNPNKGKDKTVLAQLRKHRDNLAAQLSDVENMIGELELGEDDDEAAGDGVLKQLHRVVSTTGSYKQDCNDAGFKFGDKVHVKATTGSAPFAGYVIGHTKCFVWVVADPICTSPFTVKKKHNNSCKRS